MVVRALLVILLVIMTRSLSVQSRFQCKELPFIDEATRVGATDRRCIGGLKTERAEQTFHSDLDLERGLG